MLQTCILEDIIDIPNRGFVIGLFLSIDLLLIECPVGKLTGEGPQGYLGRYVYKFEQARLGLPRGSCVTVRDPEVKQRIVVTRVVILGPCSELFVRRHSW